MSLISPLSSVRFFPLLLWQQLTLPVYFLYYRSIPIGHPPIPSSDIPNTIPTLTKAIVARYAFLLINMSLFEPALAQRAATFAVAHYPQLLLNSRVNLRLFYFLPRFSNPIPILRFIGFPELKDFPLDPNILALVYAKGVQLEDNEQIERFYQTVPKQGVGHPTRSRLEGAREKAREGTPQ